ncbi:hypothetical protein ACQV2B_19040 [Pantoea allii]|uniref:hypothetical protein n=1 Tax=Pantoea allii TaxID=574096 RepID=UPI003D31EB42
MTDQQSPDEHIKSLRNIEILIEKTGQFIQNSPTFESYDEEAKERCRLRYNGLLAYKRNIEGQIAKEGVKRDE